MLIQACRFRKLFSVINMQPERPPMGIRGKSVSRMSCVVFSQKIEGRWPWFRVHLFETREKAPCPQSID